MPQVLKIAEQIFEDFLAKKTSRLGIAIPDCRGKETLIVLRYGGDVVMTIFDNKTKKPVFDFLMEMKRNNQQEWSKIFRRFVEIKAQLI